MISKTEKLERLVIEKYILKNSTKNKEKDEKRDYKIL
jgi:hypothetical protein